MKIADKITIEYVKKAYETGDFTPYDLCREIVRRSEEIRAWNIWIVEPSMDRLQKQVERIMVMDRKTTPLWGVPFSIKDNIDLEGLETTAGCESYAYLPKESATVVRLLMEAGAIPVGKTNLDQFATGLVGTRSLYGATHNSLKPELISGGSSSGSAVSVALGLAAFSLGTDTAGSGRVPAALNNLVGFKPTIGAWSSKGVVPACRSLDCVTVFTHTTEDAMLVDSVARVHDKNCPQSREVKKTVLTIPEKILLPEEELEFFGEFEVQYRACWEKVLENIQKLGLAVEYIPNKILYEAASILYDGPWIAERWASLGAFIEENGGKGMVPVTERILKNGSREDLKAGDVFKAVHRLSELQCEIRRYLKGGVLLLPTAGGTYTIEEVNSNPVETNSKMGLYTNHCNLLDLCAVSFQAGFAGDKLPFGMTAFAPAGEDGLNLGLARLYQALANCDKAGKETVPIAVCGQHMRGMKLESQLLELGAEFDREAVTAPEYKLYKLDTVPVKPGLLHVNQEGNSIELEVWNIPVERLGEFLLKIKAPLGLGQVRLESGEEILGFLCEEYATKGQSDISELGSFKKFTQNS
ncbi:allophanate hydrolase [Ruminiclostridium hungatei]|uniref:Allophanate hydrolase n=1 Tax=Ruminiclostridium hungatei TaxID=48256 RepID=A0A1V4SNJ1_RUMHU|nr:allophanate hydrolase [Ruminiclostridium hungatei]OPX45035.1 allophanate hydrolase [Ruminiclostridium hungatei]